ncbi:leucine-rich repeat-containing protein 3-like [Vanacampus margaritifer]
MGAAPSGSCLDFLRALWLLSAMIGVARACPKTCHCAERNGAVVQCTSRDLEDVPSNVPKDTAVLLLSSNRITYLPKEAFTDLHRLRELDLSHKLIESLEVGAFQGISQGLRTLDRLSSLPRETLERLQARVRLSNNPWNCECSLQEVLRELRLHPETINEVSCHTSARDRYIGQPVVQVLDSGINFCNFHQKTTDVAMFGWFSVVTAYIIYYIRHNQEEARRHMEYLKSLPSSSHVSKDYDTASSGF